MKYLKVFADFEDAIEPINDAEAGRLFRAMLRYARTGETPKLSGNERYLWPTAKLNIDREAAFCEKQAKNGEKGGRPKNPEKPNESQTNPEKPNESQKSQKDKDKDKDKEKNNTFTLTGSGICADKPHRFTPPTLAEVRDYCLERGNTVDAERFVNYYTANGWKVGKNPMKDWRAAVRTWEREDRPSETARKNNTLLNYKETGKSHATLTDIGMDINEL